MKSGGPLLFAALSFGLELPPTHRFHSLEYGVVSRQDVFSFVSQSRREFIKNVANRFGLIGNSFAKSFLKRRIYRSQKQGEIETFRLRRVASAKRDGNLVIVIAVINFDIDLVRLISHPPFRAKCLTKAAGFCQKTKGLCCGPFETKDFSTSHEMHSTFLISDPRTTASAAQISSQEQPRSSR